MRKIYLSFLLLLTTMLVQQQASAQASLYQFTALSGTFTPVSASATSVSAILADDAFSASIPIGFTFNFAGTNYTSFFANSNGFLSFKSTATATASQQRSNSATNAGNVGPAVFPLWDDEIGYSGGLASSTARYELTGTPGSQVFTFEWKNWVWWYSSSNVAPSISFQVKLYEGTNIIEYIYQQEPNTTLNGPSATIGIASSSTDYMTLSNSTAAPSTSSSTFTTSIAAKPATGQVYRFTPPPPCVTPSAPPTALVLNATGTTSAAGSFTAATPAADRYLVVRTTTNTAPTPVNGTTYTTGTNASLGGYVELAGNATSFSSASLTAGTTYYYWVFAYNSQCTGGPLYYTAVPLSGSVTTGTSITSAASGDWNDPTTWVGTIVPSSIDQVTIAAGHTISAMSGSSNAASLTINATGILNIDGGILVVGGTSAAGVSNSGTVNINSGSLNIGAPGANNRRFTNASGGTLNVTGGDLNVYGNVAINNGSNLNQSGGLIMVDGNNGGSTTNSVATGTPLFAIGTTSVERSSGTISLTGGTIMIVDPPVGSAANDMAFFYNGAAGTTYNIVASPAHTLKFGNGVSTDASTNSTYQFGFNVWFGTSAFTPGSVVVDAVTGAGNRTVRSRYTPYIIGGNLTVMSGEFVDVSGFSTSDNRLYLGGNLTVNSGGIFTAGASIGFGNATYNADANFTITTTAASTLQTISGAGTIRNAATSPTANFTSIFVNNTVGVQSDVALTVRDSLSLNTPVFNMGANTLTLGISPTQTGVYQQLFGRIQGAFKRWMAASTGVRSFGIGTASGSKNVSINYTTAPTAGGSLTAEWVSGAPGTAGLPLTENATTYTTVSKDGYWKFTAADGLTGGVYDATFTAEGLSDIIDFSGLTVVKRPNTGANWTLDGTYAAPTGSNSNFVVARTGIATGFSDFAIAGNVSTLPVSLTSFTGKRVGNVNRLSWITATESGNMGFDLESSKDGSRFEKVTFVASKGINGNSDKALQYNYDDARAQQGKTYYRLKQINKNGSYTYSATISISDRATAGIELTDLYPNPAANSLTIAIASSEVKEVAVVVVDITGKTVLNEVRALNNGNNLVAIPVKQLNAGTYFVQLNANGQTVVTRFVKQ